ncbi:hypothetical protein LBMAG53_32760 [Planctomycetota bacterium]|nr:hypothetical protein LBMAG53_32760 [Planctomycetota bacterium]
MAADLIATSSNRAPVYDTIGLGYRRFRRPDPRIARQVHAAMGSAASVLNVGAGSGSYEPTDRPVVAVDPSLVQLRQRPPDAAPAIRGVAEHLPFADGSFAAALGVLTIHHWRDRAAGFRELQRVARERVVLLTWYPTPEGFWLTRDYFPDMITYDLRIFPSMEQLASELGRITVQTVPIPWDCVDGFGGAYWHRPDAYLDPEVRGAMSTFTRLSNVEPRLERLRQDLSSGRWHVANADLLNAESIDLGYRLVVCESAGYGAPHSRA